MPKHLFHAVLLAGVTAFAVVRPASASIFTVSVEQAGSNVVVTGDGSIDTTGLTNVGTSGINGVVYSSNQYLGIGSPDFVDAIEYTSATGDLSSIFTGSGSYATADSGSGTLIALHYSIIYVDPGYVSGTPIADTETFDNQTLANLGFVAGTATYTWSAGSIVVDVGIASAPTPEPSSLVVLAAPVALLALRRRRAGAAAA